MGAILQEQHTHGGYHAGHPWYYLLGGLVLTPKEIRNAACAATYRGYRADDIRKLATLSEPRRRAAIEKVTDEIKSELQADIARYRQCVFELHEYRRTADPSEEPPICADIHVAISLKHNHIVNGFAHLALIDELPAPAQGDLFGL